MQSLTYRGDHSYISLSERRGKSDLEGVPLDLSWASAVSESAHSRAYPSPPMSGSPPHPSRHIPGSSDRGHGSYISTGQDLTRGPQTSQPEGAPRSRGQDMQSFQQLLPPVSYSPYRLEDMPQQVPFQQQQAQIPPQQPSQHMYAPQGPPPPFSAPERPPIGSPGYVSPKAQRKTKGHVASACVPCKRAHLRCDAQRPCSRCLSNGKEDDCVDVQHKKRGRPRLRDEREPRYDSLGAPLHIPMRRPMPLYGDAPFPTFGEPPRSGSYRVLKSHTGMGSPMVPRHLEHASPGDAHIYAPSMSQTPLMTSQQEPICAYMNMEMQIAKTTHGFGETIGVQAVVSRKLHDIVGPGDRDKVSRLQAVFEEERREREPNYLPPIYLKVVEDRLIQSVGFGQEDMTQFRADRQERIAFQGPDGQQRAFQVRFGLAKKETTYFIVALLDIPAAPQPYLATSSSSYPRESYSRDSQYGFMPQQQGYQQPPISPPFMTSAGFGDPRDEVPAYRAPGALGPNAPPSANMPTFAQPQMRLDYHQGYQAQRSELPQPPPQQQQPLQPRQHDLQLPPIRDQRGEAPPGDPSQRRDDRSNRVDIGGLLEGPNRTRSQ